MVLASERTIVCWAMGLTQHKHSVPTIREVVNFLLLRGNIGRPGAGVCPVRGHCNVQGDRTMGIFERPAPAFLDALEKEFGFAPPRDHGYDVVRAIRAMRDGKAKVFFAMGGNFVVRHPRHRRHRGGDAPRPPHRARLDQAQPLARRHRRARPDPADPRPHRARPPGARRAEQFVTVEDSMGMVHASRGRLEPAERPPAVRARHRLPASPAASSATNPAPPGRSSRRTTRRSATASRASIPGFEDFNARVADPERLRPPARPARRAPLPHRHRQGQLHRRARRVPELPEGRLLLQTLRSHDQYNTTIYGLDDRYRGIKNGRRVVLVNPEDARELGLADGSYTDLVGEWKDGVERRAPGFRVVHYPTARGCAAAYYPETNVLVPLDATADTSNTPASKSVVVRLEQSAAD